MTAQADRKPTPQAHAHDKAEKTRRLRGWKLWAVRFAMALVSPALFLLLVEGVLWAVGFGRATDFLIPWQAGGAKYHITNKDFCLQFVPPELSRPPEQVLLTPKGAKTVRVFVLGGSAAAGDPDSTFGFCRVLEDLLNDSPDGPTVPRGDRGPSGRRFEVVNAAVTAMNSHVARRIARDCAEHSPDAFVVYMGNNEVVGPYGPASLPASLYGSTALIRTLIAAKGTRVGQLLGRLVRPADAPVRKWQGMEAFLADQVPLADSRLADCYEHFEANLRDIASTARKAHAGLVLCTVPTNLRACAPFGSKHRPGLAAEALRRWEQEFDEGARLQQAGRHADALARYRSAAQTDDAHAELAFRMAQCTEQAGPSDEAARLYRRARDLDTLRFRADTRINEIIRSHAEAGEQVALADLEADLTRHADKGVLSAGLLLDHVHLSFRGNVLAAACAARAIARVLPRAGIRTPEETQDPAGLYERLRGRFLFDAHAQFDLAMTVYRRKTRPPFAGQAGHDAEMAALRDQIVALRRVVRGLDAARLEKEYVQAVEARPFDAAMSRRLGELLIRHGKVDEAVRQLRKRLADHPYCAATREASATALAAAGEVDEALAVLTSTDNPYAMDLKRALGHVGTAMIQHARAADSAKVHQRLLDLDPRNVDALVNLGAAALGDGAASKAQDYLERALKIDPANVDAMVNLANSYVKRQKPKDAGDWFLKAVREDPYHSTAQVGLALELAREGKVAQALEHAQRAIDLNPAFFQAYGVLASLWMQQGDRAKAERCAELAKLFAPAR